MMKRKSNSNARIVATLLSALRTVREERLAPGSRLYRLASDAIDKADGVKRKARRSHWPARSIHGSEEAAMTVMKYAVEEVRKSMPPAPGGWLDNKTGRRHT